MGYNYNINSENKDVIVFTESGSFSGCLFFVSLLIGVIGLGVAGYLVYDYLNTSEPLGLTFYIALGFGLAFGSAGISLKLFTGKHLHKIEFDNIKSCVKVTLEKDHKLKEALIPYQDILMFDYRTESSSGSSSRTYYNYVVFWRKKDGGVWDIKSFTKQSNAEKLIEELKQIINLDQISKVDFAPKLPKGITLKNENNSAVFEWKNKFSFKSILFLIVFGGIISAAYGIIANQNTEEVFVTVFFYFFFGVAAFIFSVFLYNVIKDLLFSHHLEINQNALVYSLISKNKKRVMNEIPINEIRAVSFDLNGEEGGSSIIILDEKQFETSQRALFGEMGIADLGSLFKSSFGTLKLNIDAFDVVDKIHFETILQMIIKKQGGDVV